MKIERKKESGRKREKERENEIDKRTGQPREVTNEAAGRTPTNFS